MSVRVLIPTPLQRLTQNQAEVVADGSDIRELISNLDAQFPGVKARLCDENGALRRFVNIYLNEEDIRFLKGEATPLKDGDEVSIVPAIAGGMYV
jgi:sulfur-carrier protein